MSTQRNSLIAKAVRFALVGGAFASVATGVAFAAEDEKEERIEVTGSRIKRTDIETVNPVLVIDRLDIEKSGVQTMGEVLRQAPVIAGAGTNPQVNNGGGLGTTGIDLRGMGVDRTLILIDGRRMLSKDPNQIPIAIVERVEILKDGASSVYGSDAVAGVVNVITRKDFEGVVTNVFHSETSENDGQENSGDITFGLTSERGHLVAGVSYISQHEISAGDRDFSKEDVYLYDGTQYVGGSPTPPWGRFNVPRATAEALGFHDCGGGGANNSWLTWNGTGDGSDLSNYRCFNNGAGVNDYFNFQPDNLIQTPVERKNFFVKGAIELANDVEAFTHLTYNTSYSKYQIAALPQGSLTIGANNQWNPFGVAISGNAIRANGFSRRSTEYNNNNFDMIVGLRGSFGDSWDWDSHYSWSEDLFEGKGHGYIYKPSLTDALDGVGDNQVNLLWLGGLVAPGNAAEQAAYDALVASSAPTLNSTNFARQKMFEANVTGEIVDLPAGPLAVAVGVSHQDQYSSFEPDYLAITCVVAAEACSQPLSGGYQVDEAYVEFAIPLFTGLDLSLGSRMSDYTTSGNTTNSKLGLSYRPVDGLLLRTTFAEVFRAPTISDLFQGTTSSADTYADPCNGLELAGGVYTNAQGVVTTNPGAACENVPTDGSFTSGFDQLNSNVGGNLNLKPEQGETFTVGAVWSPSFLTGFSTSVDYYEITLEDTIDVVGTQNILDICYTTGIYCDRLHRDASGDWNEGESSIDNPTSNVGDLSAKGVDFGVTYKMSDLPFGSLGFNLDGTYIIEQDKASVSGLAASVKSNAGYFYDQSGGGSGAFPRVRANLGINWSMGDWDAVWNMRYIGEMLEDGKQADDCIKNNGVDNCPNASTAPRPIEAYVYHDVQLSYNVGVINSRFSVGVQNATDEQPPLIYSGFNARTDVRTYDTAGQTFYARVTTTF